MSLTQESFDSLVQLAIKGDYSKFRGLFVQHFCDKEKTKRGFKKEYGDFYFDNIVNSNNQLISFSENEIVQTINKAFATEYSYTTTAESELELFKKNHPVYRTFEIAATKEVILVPVTDRTTMQDIREYIAEYHYKDKFQASQLAIASGIKLVSEQELLLKGSSILNDHTIGKVVLLDQYELQGSSQQLDLSHHYRVWFSNNKNSFLPQVERTIIETSIELNPAVRTHLIVNKEMLSSLSRAQLTLWGKKNKCEIIDIAVLDLKSELDKLILAMAKSELANWTSGNRLGNPGLASDLVRLLYIDQGVYLDCDIFTCENIPTKLTTHQAAITAFLDISLGALNNNMMAFSSEAGKDVLQKFKQLVVNKYFGELRPCMANLAAVMDYRQQACKNLNKTDLRSYLSTLVTSTSGPWVLKEFCDSVKPPINNLESEVVDYIQHLFINAGNSFDELKSAGLSAGNCSWLPGTQKDNVGASNLELMSKFKVHLKEWSDAATKNFTTQVVAKC